MTETSLRVSPGGSVNHFGSRESLAKYQTESKHPPIAQHERHIATISRTFFARGQSLDCRSERIIGTPYLLLQGPIIGRRRANVGDDCDTFASVTMKNAKNLNHRVFLTPALRFPIHINRAIFTHREAWAYADQYRDRRQAAAAGGRSGL